MWFDELMDDLKHGLWVANNNKKVFVPIFIKLGLNILFFIYLFISIIAFGIMFFRTSFNRFNALPNIMRNLPFVVIAILIAYVLYIVLNSLLEVGSINMYKAAVVGIKPSSSHFFEGMKKYFLKVLGGNLFIHLITLILSPIIIALTIIYAVIFGTLTAGWALILLSVLVMVFLGVWNIIVVVDDIPPIKAIGIGITFGKKYFWPLFIVMLSNIMLTKYLAAAFGPLAAIIAGWFIVGIVTTYFKVVVLLIYNRRKADLI